MEEKAHSLLPLLSLIALGCPAKDTWWKDAEQLPARFLNFSPAAPGVLLLRRTRWDPWGWGPPGAPPGASSGGAEGGGGGQGKVPPCWGALRGHRDGSLGLKLKGAGRNGSRGEVVPG